MSLCAFLVLAFGHRHTFPLHHNRIASAADMAFQPDAIRVLQAAKVSPKDKECGAANPNRSPNCCAAAKRLPQSPKFALKFCNMFPDQSCCLPAQDAEIEEYYFNLIDAGDICAKEASSAKDSLKRLFCASCSPKQPKYIQDGKFRVCSTLARAVDPLYFDDCGLVVVEERGMPCKGDDVVVPSHHWADCENGDGIQHISSTSETFKPLLDSADSSKLADQCSNTLYQQQSQAQASCSATPQFASFASSWSGDCQPSAGPNANTIWSKMPTFEKCCDKTQVEDCTDAGLAPKPYSCLGYYKFINDNTGAKPPGLDDYEIEIVECDPRTTDCSTICYTGSATRTAGFLWFSIPAIVLPMWLELVWSSV